MTRGALQLSIALGNYDINQALIDGTVRPQGVELLPTVLKSPQRHWRMLIHEDFDVCELSMGSFAAMVSRGDDRFVGIPVFPHRRFRHSYVFVSGALEVEKPADLRGTRIGVRSWQTTAGIYIRGFLADHYGLPLDAVEWVAQDDDDIPVDLPDGVRLTRVEPGQTVTELCARGELAGLVYPEIPEEVHEQTGRIRRLFPDSRAEEQRSFRETGIFPIMHVVVLRRELAERHPWLCRNLMEAFDLAKQAAIDRLKDPRSVSLAWLRSLIEEERALLGPDPWVYGIDPNRHVLETFLRYSQEQGVAARAVEVDELFAASVRDQPPAYV